MISLLAIIKKQNSSIQIIVLTSFQTDKLVQKHPERRGNQLHDENVSARALAAAIRTAKNDKMTLSPEAAQALVHASQQTQETESLTEREREVLKLMVEGLNNAELAERLVISLSTVKCHISNILMKLGVDNRVGSSDNSAPEKVGLAETGITFTNFSEKQ